MADATTEQYATDAHAAQRQLWNVLGLPGGTAWPAVIDAVCEALSAAQEDTREMDAEVIRSLSDALEMFDQRSSTSPFTFSGALSLIDAAGDAMPLPVRYDLDAEHHVVLLRPGVTS
jgi:hypothetical protein